MYQEIAHATMHVPVHDAITARGPDTDGTSTATATSTSNFPIPNVPFRVIMTVGRRAAIDAASKTTPIATVTQPAENGTATATSRTTLNELGRKMIAMTERTREIVPLKAHEAAKIDFGCSLRGNLARSVVETGCAAMSEITVMAATKDVETPTCEVRQ